MDRATLKEEVLDILKHNARTDNGNIALQLGVSVEDVAEVIGELEQNGTVLGYTPVTSEVSSRDGVLALIEVKVQPEPETGFDRVARELANFPEVESVYLVSGHYDLLLQLKGRSLQEVAGFVASRLSSMSGVKSTSTLFMLKKYKESGIEIGKEVEDERLKVTP